MDNSHIIGVCSLHHMHVLILFSCLNGYGENISIDVQFGCFEFRFLLTTCRHIHFRLFCEFFLFDHTRYVNIQKHYTNCLKTIQSKSLPFLVQHSLPRKFCDRHNGFDCLFGEEDQREKSC